MTVSVDDALIVRHDLELTVNEARYENVKNDDAGKTAPSLFRYSCTIRLASAIEPSLWVGTDMLVVISCRHEDGWCIMIGDSVLLYTPAPAVSRSTWRRRRWRRMNAEGVRKSSILQSSPQLFLQPWASTLIFQECRRLALLKVHPKTSAHAGKNISNNMRKPQSSPSSSVSPADYAALKNALARDPSDLLAELRSDWDLPEGKPIRVVGRASMSVLDDGREICFLREIEHPVTGVGLLYPGDFATSDARATSASAFIPAGSWHAIDPELASSGGQWAIAELELSPHSERLKQRNPWLQSVRSGTLRPLSEIPSGWELNVSGPVSARRISALARDEIEEYLRDLVLREDEDLARRLADNDKALDALIAARRQAEAEAKAAHEQIAADIESHRKIKDQTKDEVLEVQSLLEDVERRLATYRQSAEQEKLTMELAHRRLKEFLADKGDRLVALGLADRDDVDALLPDLGEFEDSRGGVELSAILPEGFSQVAVLLQRRLAEQGLLYSQAHLRDFLALLRTRDLVILAGDSGSGKTSLVRATAEVIGGVCEVIPVKPNWTGPEDLLGYYNPIERSYQATPFLLALQAAASNPSVPYFICLDEMNLARVEHYFADFLSLLEQRSKSPEIALYTSDEERHVVVEQGVFLKAEEEVRRRFELADNTTLEDILRHDQANAELHRLCGLDGKESVLNHHARLRRSLSAQLRVPTSIKLPDNVWILGAVNMDDTTHHLSPKVLDRVHVLRFRNPMLADWDMIENEVAEAKTSLPADLGDLRMTPEDFGGRGDYPSYDRHDADVAFLSHLSRAYLDPLGVEFGLRAIRQSQGYMIAARDAGIGADEALDNVIKHKILPKVAFDTARPAGSGRSRREILDELRGELMGRFEGSNLDPEVSSVGDLGRMISLADGNNGIVNYWLR